MPSEEAPRSIRDRHNAFARSILLPILLVSLVAVSIGQAHTIHLQAGYLLNPNMPDPEGTVPLDLRASLPTGNERAAFLVQFQNLITQQDHAFIESIGGTVHAYIPKRCLLVSLSSHGYATAAGSPQVMWAGLYHPAYKISPHPIMRTPDRFEAKMLLFKDASIESITSEVNAAGASVIEAQDNGYNKILTIELDQGDVPGIARIGGVAWIEPHLTPKLYNSDAQWVVQTWVPENRKIWDLGIHGENEILHICDSGIRTTHEMFHDPSVPLVDFGDYPQHRKIIAYVKSVEHDDIEFGDEFCHGTPVSCTAAGDDAPVSGTSPEDGMAKQAKIYFQDAGGPGVGILIPTDLNDLFIDPYDGNSAGAARVPSNSWGHDTQGYYDTHAMTVDQFMWWMSDFLAFFPVGSGPGLSSPAVAKNVVSVGATGNGLDADQYYPASAHGPTQDGRIKPTLLAPGQLQTAYCTGDADYVQFNGTSVACPAAAGAMTLIRQYLTEGWYPTGTAVLEHAIPFPSAALMKAIAINSASPDVDGYEVPSNAIGWGRILLDDTLYFLGDERRLVLYDFRDGLRTGEHVEFEISVVSGALPLKATLVWTDYPGYPGADIQLVNDLNLIANDGTQTYLGNVYEGGESIPGGEADYLNVEECVRRNAPEVGLWTFRIEAENCPYGPQPFALVVTGAMMEPAGVEEPAAPSRSLRLTATPNPFHLATAVAFDLRESVPVALSIYDVTGREVQRLVEGVLPAGHRSTNWDGADDTGHPVGSGIYFCRLTANGFKETRRLTLLR